MTGRAACAVLLVTSIAAAEPPTKDACVAAYVDAQHARRDGALRRARDQLLVCVQAECPQMLQNDCSPWLAEVQALMPSLVFVVRDAAGRDRGDVAVTVDGTPLVARLDGLPVDVDPGDHLFRFEAAGASAVEQRVLVHEGEKARRVDITLATPATVATVDRPQQLTRRPLTPMCWVALGIGAAGLATAAVAGGANLPTWLRCHDGGCSAADQHDSDRLNTIGDIALVTGVAGALVAWYFIHARPTVMVEPAGSAGATIQVRAGF